MLTGVRSPPEKLATVHMKPFMKIPFCAAVAAIAAAFAARADFAVDWYTISGGGGVSTGSVYQVTATIGQPAADAMSAGRYTVQSGFWGLIAAVQTPGTLLLRIALTATNTAVLSWPVGPTEFILQQNSDLSTTNWVCVSQAPVAVGEENQVIVQPPAGNRFY